MNQLPRDTRRQILHLLVEGASMRATSRLADVSINTVKKLLIDAGTACAEYHDKTVRNVPAREVQCDELWSYCYAYKRNIPQAKAAPDRAGDVWTWVALDPDSKLVVSFLAGNRDTECAIEFMKDLKMRLDKPGRLAKDVIITTDSHKPYEIAADHVFGPGARLIQTVGGDGETSYVERQNLTMRMSMRRYARKTNAFSKKFENHCHTLCLYFVYYNFCRYHQSIRMTPAMAAGLIDDLRDIGFIVDLVEQAN